MFQRISKIASAAEKYLLSKQYLVLSSYAAFFALFFATIKNGVGQYWDWSFPFFSSQINNFFENKSESWTSVDIGSPLGYSTDYFLRFVISKIIFIPPELFRYLLIAGLFSLGAFGIFKLCSKHTNFWFAILLGMFGMLNAAVFYKYTAGHINYLIAYVTFIYFLYFLFYGYKKNFASGITLGLLIALMGVQIQFFIIIPILLVIYFAANRSKIDWKILLSIVVIPVLVSLVWITNFIVGGVDVNDASAAAAKVSVKGSTSSNFLSVFTFNFSRATQLTRYYEFLELLAGIMLFVFLCWRLIVTKSRRKTDLILLIFLLILIFLATGLFQYIDVKPISSFFPILREVGHFAPIIILVSVLLLARLIKDTQYLSVVIVALLILTTISGIKFQTYSQAISFDEARTAFEPFKNFAERDKSNYRILTYPFFGQYSIDSVDTKKVNGSLLNNSGHDSFSVFSSQNYIQNAIPPHEFNTSMQKRLLDSYNIDVLRPYNVKYIFDFTSIYESNYERYVPASTYDGDLSLIKNDQDFFEKLIANNPGRLERVSDNILRVVDYSPRVSSLSKLTQVPNGSNIQDLEAFTRSTLQEPLDYTTDFDAKSYQAHKLNSLFDDVNYLNLDNNNSINETLNRQGEGKTTLYENTSFISLTYTATQDEIVFYASRPGILKLNGKSVSTNSSKVRIGSMARTQNAGHYISFKNELSQVVVGDDVFIGEGSVNDAMQVYTSKSENAVKNGTFEDGLWQQKVGDCNKYDSNPILGMKQSTETPQSSKFSLQLEATRHNACASTDLKLKSNQQYVLSFDYQSPNAKTANYYLSYGNKDENSQGTRSISDNTWQKIAVTIRTPENTANGRLFLYANESDGVTNVINRYDNVSLMAVEMDYEYVIPQQIDPYRRVEIQNGSQMIFEYSNSTKKVLNLISNPSFERSSWQEKVSDCNNYDDNPVISAEIDEGNSTEGAKSLKLSSTRHNACVSTLVNVTGESEYMLSFDYLTDQSKYYGYAATFDDESITTIDERLSAQEKSGWHEAKIRISVPKGATTMKLYLYAYEDGNRRNTVWYDNIGLYELPEMENRYIVTSAPTNLLVNPKGISFTHGITKTEITALGAKNPFIISFSEAYHPKWQLSSTNTNTVIKTHFRLNGDVNGWYVDPGTLCKQDDVCKKNADGSFDINFAAEFTPQKWFNIGRAISAGTLIISIVYLLSRRMRKKDAIWRARR